MSSINLYKLFALQEHSVCLFGREYVTVQKNMLDLKVCLRCNMFWYSYVVLIQGKEECFGKEVRKSPLG